MKGRSNSPRDTGGVTRAIAYISLLGFHSLLNIRDIPIISVQMVNDQLMRLIASVDEEI